MKPVRRSPECWLKLFKQHEKSGQSMKDFCQPLGINPKYFSLRRKKLDYLTQSMSNRAAFVQVLPGMAQNSSITVKLTSGLSIEFNALPTVEYLQALTGTLE